MEGDNFFASGFRPHSAQEMALIASDENANFVVVGVLHFVPSRPEMPDNPVLQLYSEAKSLSELPEPIRKRIDKFKSDFELNAKKFAGQGREYYKTHHIMGREKYIKSLELKVQETRLN